MTASPQSAVVAVLARTLALLVLVALPLPLPPASAAETIQRIAGSDRIDTAVQLARQTTDGGAPTVLLARADTFTDALSGGPLAAALEAPMLVTGQTLDPRVRATLVDLDVEEVLLLGGPQALPAAVEQELRGMGVQVRRLAGPDRYATAAAVAAALPSSSTTAYVARGAAADPDAAWPDALSATGMASRQGAPLLLTTPDAVPDATLEALDDLGTQQVVLVGGTTAVSTDVEQQLQEAGLDVDRVAGPSRYDTATAAADQAESVTGAWVATGAGFADALVAAPAAAAQGAVLLLTAGEAAGDADPAVRWVAANRARLDRVAVVGGEAAVSPVVAQRLQSALDGTPPSPPAGEVRLALGDHFQSVIDDHPPGTTFVIAAGHHREQVVVPRDGDRFIGEDGAVMTGSRVLRAQDFVAAGGRWYVDGQSQQGFIKGVDTAADPRDAHPEEVFVDGTVRLDHVGSLEDLRPGAFFFDYAADRIWLHDDPSTFQLIETSTAPFAFGGNAVRDVHIENITVQKYATPSQRGAVGGAIPFDHPHDWVIKDVTVRYNHGAGITIGPGMHIEGVDVHHNGQIGLIGSGTDRENGGYTAPVTIVRSRIHHNNELGFHWEWEAGAAKFKAVRGMLFEHNWVHDNGGPGPWWDTDNADITVRSNLVEDNDAAGIFYEMSFGGTVITGNTVRDNGRDPAMGAHRTGIQVFNSEGVHIVGNAVSGQPIGIRLNHASRDVPLRDVVVEGNDVHMTEFTGIQAPPDDGHVFTDAGNRFLRNTYWLPAPEARVFSFDNARRTSEEWQAFGMDVDGRFTVGNRAELPPGVAGFQLQPRYGAR